MAPRRKQWDPGRDRSINSLSYDNLRVVKPRSDTPDSPRGTGQRLAPWLVAALIVAAGVLLAFRYGTRVTPLLDGIR
jgi:hypothetical protein